MGCFHGDLHKKNIIITKDIVGNDQPIFIDFGTSHFSGKEESEKRDAKMLYKLCFEVLPEFQKFAFIEKSIIEQGSFVICEFFQHLLGLLNKYINNEKWDIYAQHEYCFSLSVLKWNSIVWILV